MSEKSIGGYFELECREGRHLHEDAVRLGSGRAGLGLALQLRGYRRLYMPCYTCGVLMQPLRALGVEPRFYHIDSRFEITNLPTLGEDEALLYTNYYAMKGDYVRLLADRVGERLIVDNAQAFYEEPLPGIDTFYSPRKFFGVADGGYLYCSHPDARDAVKERMHSHDKMRHLLIRLEEGAEAGYPYFQEYEEMLDSYSLSGMSRLTEALLGGVDYERAAEKRWDNFRRLHEALGGDNLLPLDEHTMSVPFVYPYLSDDTGLRKRLISSRIYVARYWPAMEEWTPEGSAELRLRDSLVPLPIDQRYDGEDMQRIIRTVRGR